MKRIVTVFFVLLVTACTPAEELPEPPYEHHENVDAQTSPVPHNLSRWYKGNVRHNMDLSTIMSGGPGKDGIPALTNPQFIDADEDVYLEKFDTGVLLNINGDARFYPYALLHWHEIVNDTVGGEDVIVTYCPLCRTAVTYSRNISKGSVEFGVSGLLAQSNLLMYDRATESLWNQVTGEAVVGPLTGEALEYIPSNVMRFPVAKKLHPKLRVLSPNTGYRRDYKKDPYRGYFLTDDIMFPVSHKDDRLKNKQMVYGVVVNGQAKAYEEEALRIQQVLHDTVGGQKITITFDTKKEELIVKDSSGNIVPVLPSFWFAWFAQHPETELYK